MARAAGERATDGGGTRGGETLMTDLNCKTG